MSWSGNPDESAIDHDCRTGCAMVVLAPKLHAFDDCFRGRIGMSDIHGVIERHGYVVFLEWKKGGDIEKAPQVLVHQHLTKNSKKHLSVFVVGNPQTMEPVKLRVMERGDWRGEWQQTSLEDLQRRFANWFLWADAREPVSFARAAE